MQVRILSTRIGDSLPEYVSLFGMVGQLHDRNAVSESESPQFLFLPSVVARLSRRLKERRRMGLSIPAIPKNGLWGVSSEGLEHQIY